MPATTFHRSSSLQIGSRGGALGLSGLSTRAPKISTVHSPDGYFSPSEELRQSLRNPFNGAVDIRRRSRDLDIDLQDVQEDENADINHIWHRPNPRTDSRSPCPALNAAANHGYLPRDGRSLSMWTIIKALRECYRVSWALAIVFTVGSFIILRVGGVGRGWWVPTIDLEDLSAHNVLEHNASLTHRDVEEAAEAEERWRAAPRSRSVSTSSMAGFRPAHPSHFSFHIFPLTPARLVLLVRSLPAFFITIVLSILAPPDRPNGLTVTRSRGSPHGSPISTSPPRPHHGHTHACAPSRPSTTLINRLFSDSASGTHLTLKDVARARIRRLEECAGRSTVTPPHLEQFADSEFCLTIALFSVNPKELKVELSALREWLEDERLPTGWKPKRDLGLWENHTNTAKLQKMMAAIKKYKSPGRAVKSVVFE